MQLSVIIPTFNDELTIGKTLDALSRLVNVDEIIIVDGGSADNTTLIIENYSQDKPLRLVNIHENNRGRQLHEGTLHASGEAFWFLHADTRPVQGCAKQIKEYMRYAEVTGGNFEVVFEGDNRTARFLRRLYPNMRSLNLIYGDSAMFARRETYEQIKGFKPLPIFEDIDLRNRLLKKGRFVNVNLAVTVSAQRFKNRSFFRTLLRWSILQGLHWTGVPPRLLAKVYGKLK